MRKTLSEDVEREPAHMLAKVAAQGAGGDRAQQASLDAPREALGVVLEQGAALGMGKHDRLTAIVHSEQQDIEIRVGLPHRALDQQKATRAEAQPVELVTAQIR